MYMLIITVSGVEKLGYRAHLHPMAYCVFIQLTPIDIVVLLNQRLGYRDRTSASH